LDPTGKGLRDQEVGKLLASIDMNILIKPRQFNHIYDELKLVKYQSLIQVNKSDKLEKLSKKLEKKKDDSFITYKYDEIKRVIEDKWYLIKEIY
jgi:hypothetical protein